MKQIKDLLLKDGWHCKIYNQPLRHAVDNFARIYNSNGIYLGMFCFDVGLSESELTLEEMKKEAEFYVSQWSSDISEDLFEMELLKHL